MLIALLTMYLYGGGTPMTDLDFIVDSRIAVESVVTDEQRQRKALDVLDAVELAVTEHEARKVAILQHLEGLLSDYNSSEDQFSTTWNDFYTDVHESDEAFIELRFALRDILTEDEWQRIFNSEENP